MEEGEIFNLNIFFSRRFLAAKINHNIHNKKLFSILDYYQIYALSQDLNLCQKKKKQYMISNEQLFSKPRNFVFIEQLWQCQLTHHFLTKSVQNQVQIL